MSSRRVFVMTLVAGVPALAARTARAQTRVDPKDPSAMALGYAADTTKVDARRYPRHDKAQNCANCQLYRGAGGSAEGPCPLFPEKVVAAAGWCASWQKKP